MADKCSIVVTTQDPSGKLQERTVPYVNPQALNSQLKIFAQKTAALTNNSYVKTTRITESDCD